MDAGLFATSRRGGLTMTEMREIEAHRSRDRPTPWQALANRYGRSVEEVKAVLHPPVAKDEPEPVSSTWGEEDLYRLAVMINDLKFSPEQIAAAMQCEINDIVIGRRFLDAQSTAIAA